MAELQLRNTSNDELSLSNGVSVVPDGQGQASSGAQPDARVPGGTGDAWAQRWSRTGSPDLFQGTSPLTLSVWVAGPHYVTARAEITLPVSP